MIRKINEKARRALKKSLMIGGAVLFVTAVAGCDELRVASNINERAAAEFKTAARAVSPECPDGVSLFR